MRKSSLVFEDIINKIKQNHYHNGSKLPTERELMNIYNTSRYNVRKALKKLEEINYITKVQGAGNYINNIEDQPLVYNSMIAKSFNDIRSILLYLSCRPANKNEAEIFNISEVDMIWEFHRIRIINYQKAQVEYTKVPQYLFKILNKEIIEGSIHSHVIDLGYKISHSITEYSAINISKETAKLLDCKKGIAAIKINNKGYLNNDVVFEITESININYSCSFMIDYNHKLHTHRLSKKAKRI